jgi:hypothetical protein
VFIWKRMAEHLLFKEIDHVSISLLEPCTEHALWYNSKPEWRIRRKKDCKKSRTVSRVNEQTSALQHQPVSEIALDLYQK